MIVEEALASGDGRFVELLRACDDPRGLGRIVERWKKDHRPWARQQILVYLELPLDRAGHEVVVKRLFKHAEANRDHDLVGAFMAAFDRLVRRRRVRHYHWDWQTRQGFETWVLRARWDRVTARPEYFPPQDWEERVQRRGLRLFSKRTRHYLRRRAWRYFRRLGYQQPDSYCSTLALALARYRDEDLGDGLAVMDQWGLMHACFGQSPAVRFNASYSQLREERELSQMVAPYFEDLWANPDAADVLLGIALGARSRIVRLWAVTLVRRHHLDHMAQVKVGRLIAILDHEDPQVQSLGADLIAGAKDLEKLDVETWLRLLQTRNASALVAIAEAMRRHVRADQLSLEQLVELACARPVPVARLGLELLQQRTLAGESERALMEGLANAKSEGIGADLAQYALSILGTAQRYQVDEVIRFFDSLLLSMREGAWAWLLAPGSAGWNDTVLWSRLLETPYDDLRLKLVSAMEGRAMVAGGGGAADPMAGEPERLSALWCAVLLGVHRGGRTKLVALGQISRALTAAPEHAATLLPVLAVAVRSVRLPEARRGLAAVVTLVDRHPDLLPLVQRHFPELSFDEAAASASQGGGA